MRTGNLRRWTAALVALLASAAAVAQGQLDQAAREVAELLTPHTTISDAMRTAGSAAFQGNCAGCHDAGVNRAPPTMMLGNLAPEAILRTITSGAMREQAARLSPDQKRAVAEFLAGREVGGAIAGPLMCSAKADWFDMAQPPAFDGWGLDGTNGHSISGPLAGINRANLGTLKLKWALAFPNVLNARSQPAIAGGAMFVGSDDGTVYALDLATGCAHWTYAASGTVRTGIVVSPWNAGRADAAPLVYFGDLMGNAYALDAVSGKQVWKRKMDDHPNAVITAAPTLSDGTLLVAVSSLEEPAAAVPSYACCRFRGSVVALNGRTGAEKWRRYLADPPKLMGKNAKGVDQWGPSGVAVWSSPVVDRRRSQIYIATGDNYSEPATKLSDAIVALDLASGAIKWSRQVTPGDAWNVSCGWVDVGNCPTSDGPDYDFGAAPVLAKGADGKDYVLAGQKSGSVYALDPASGRLRWTRKLGRGGALGGVHFGLATKDGKVLVPISDFPAGGREMSQPATPGLYALDVATGKPVWSTPAADECGGRRFCFPGYGGAISVTDQLVLAGSTDAHLRIFDVTSGKLLWDMDTNRAYTGVNGATAHGGSMSGAGAPIAYHGQLIVNSGYGGLGKMPGNVLLVYGVD